MTQLATVPHKELVTVVYPRASETDTILVADAPFAYDTVTDSLFLLGHVADPKGQLWINDRAVAIHKNGGWLAWVPQQEAMPLPDSLELGQGLCAPVTIRYLSRSYKQRLPRSFTRTFHLVQQFPETNGADEHKFHDELHTLTVSSSFAKIRCGWPGTYDIFPPVGTMLQADGYVGLIRKMWRVALGEGRNGWISDGHISVLPEKVSVPRQVIHKVLCDHQERTTTITVPVQAKLPFRIDQTDHDQLELTLYSTVSWTDLIVQPIGSKAVREIRWTQVDSSTYRLRANVDPAWFWGWRAEYPNDTTLVWSIYQAPDANGASLKGLTIALDPGHGAANYSAIGPTGLPEKTANLDLASVLAPMLRKRGASVHVTRTDDSFLGLAERVSFADSVGADFLISLHHNALPQGKNPWEHHGASVHYYNQFAKPLADKLYLALSERGWCGDAIRYQDLALTRPTFCPSVLLEVGFMMHPEEEALFKKRSFQKKMAKRICRGIEAYLEELTFQQEVAEP